jgi:CRP/FNR family transcriptional regulator
MLQAMSHDYDGIPEMHATAHAAPHPDIRPFDADAGLVLLNALAAAHHDGLGGLLPVPSAQRVAAGVTLLHEGATATQVCVIQAGTFKCVKTAEDGYEHVLAFAMRGDLLGYDGLAAGHYASTAIALEDSRVIVVPLSLLDGLRRADAALDHALQRLLSRQIAHSIELAELMAAVAAEARLARFLLHLSARMAERGLSPRRLLLRMNRRDIAAHLGLAHETVSRSFRLLVDQGCLAVDNREVEILDFEALRTHARSTRGLCDDNGGGRNGNSSHWSAGGRDCERAAA